MADRYTYVPLIGLFIILAWGIPDIMLGRANGENITRRAARIGFVAVIATAIIAILMLLTYKQVGYWRNDITLWTHTLSVTKRNAKGHYNLGARLDALGDNEGAKKHFEEALRIDPRKYEAHSNLGIILYMEGKKDEALAHFRAAIEIKPESAECQCNLASALLESGEVEEAIAHYEISLRLRPDDNIRAMLDSIKSVRQKAQ
jgi:tetratricopeptide (TPR) repeat protein